MRTALIISLALFVSYSLRINRIQQPNSTVKLIAIRTRMGHDTYISICSYTKRKYSHSKNLINHMSKVNSWNETTDGLIVEF